MAGVRTRRSQNNSEDYWPGFVDAMSALLLVFIFLLSIFMIAQFFLSQQLSGRDKVLNRLNQQIAELTELLALEKASVGDLESTISSLQLGLDQTAEERDRLQGLLNERSGQIDEAGGALASLRAKLEGEQQISDKALAQVELLNQQISALRRQIAVLEDALDASETRDRESQTRIADLGKRLNVALAQRVQELSRYRSDFFGRLREILAQRSDIEVVGDRFVFQSEVLFSSGDDEVNPQGKNQLDILASAILELEGQIPSEINWVLRVDGHTDARPLSGTGRLRDNWELSAARAISVVKYLIARGVEPDRLVAAGFGEFQPLEEGTTNEANAKNRRIELKLTQR
ncbi:putative lipoprotein YiaD precursor [Pseudovibrio sp. W64]|uniref:peptidoglycan -binding protein n=1 Tax=unclassified Pseudovibrio TaxID=2627060 RepID=UPI00070C68A4|nr:MULTISPECIES: peptidoglycan -binding protein [unclassified Pseudovibrio]KZK76493.1 putative lipoprotein YiaD precursor [Pseudovibrio sp. Ad46]KZK88270.1 putative lipoprotein YiaD precursor [Pseudovibrio sp. W64]KZK96973.1 putative lipoprotein YiaD precursor [Pseudovibrio sp. Ad26]KZL01358.1 putative lipoprotein YiaD precursor [Pseudovibrio sp. Ad5]